MKHLYTIIIVNLFYCANVFAQQATIDTIPFSLEKRLIVFRGSINGTPIDFAFDTGSTTTVSNTNTNSAANIEVLAGQRKVKDANQQVAKVDNTFIPTLAIGSKKVTNFKGLSYNMQYLNCANLVLLGQDVIKKFNWKIDFQKQVLYISSTPFKTAYSMITWPITYKGGRPHVNFSVKGTAYSNCLIDMGFTQIFDVNQNVDVLDNESKNKISEQKAKQFITSSMGLLGLGKPDTVSYFVADSLYLNNTLFTKVPVSLSSKTDTKLGVQFFNGACKQLVFNFSSNTMHLLLKNEEIAPLNQFDAAVIMQDGKLVVASKNINPHSTASALSIGEHVKAVNGKHYSDFTSECEYLLWTYQYKEPTITIEKMNGEIITLKRSTLL
jgi:hypothetical protein